MASIQKRGSRWFARYRDDTGREHGQRFDRKVDAQRWLDEATISMVTGRYVDPRAGRVIFPRTPSSGELHRCTAHRRLLTSRRCCADTPTPAFGDRPIGRSGRARFKRG